MGGNGLGIHLIHVVITRNVQLILHGYYQE